MRKIVLLVLAFWGIAGMAMAQEQKTVSRFEGQQITGIDVSGAFQIKMKQGGQTGASVTIPARFEKQLIFSLESDGNLKIGFTGKIHLKSGDKLTVEISCSSLAKVDLSGACRLVGTGDFSGGMMKFDLSGVTTVTFDGMLRATEKLEADLSGTSVLSVKAETRNVSIELSGASQMTLFGKATSGKLEVSGASRGNLEEFNASDLYIEISGASSAVLGTVRQLSGEVSGASRVTYKGNPETQVSVSGTSTLKGV